MSARFRELRSRNEDPPVTRYRDDDFDNRFGRIIRRNGNLTLVEDEETSVESWRSPHEVDQ